LQLFLQGREQALDDSIKIQIRVLHIQSALMNEQRITCYPSSIFNRAAINALKKWKYKPAFEDGVAISQYNISTRISFELDQ